MVTNFHWQQGQHKRLRPYLEVEPSSRFRKSPLYENPPAWNFAKALIRSVDVFSESLFLDANVVWLPEEIEHADGLTLNRVASFLGWSCEFEYEQGAKELVGDATEDQIDKLHAWLKVTANVKEIMYPKDDVVKRAISTLQVALNDTEDNGTPEQAIQNLRAIVIGIIRGAYNN